MTALQPLALTPRAPFDFDRSLAFLGHFAPAYGDQSIQDGVLTKALRVNGQTAGFRVRSAGTVEQPRLELMLYGLPDEADPAPFAARISQYLSIDDDLLPFYALAEADVHFAPVLHTLYGYHQVRFMSPFENVVWAMLSSRNGYENALASRRRLMRHFGTDVSVDGARYQAFPEAADLAQASSEDLLEIARQDYRAMYLSAAIDAFAAVSDDWLRTAPYDEVYGWLRAIHGVGEWTASFVMIRALGRMERLDAPEKVLINVAARRYGVEPTASAVRRLCARYGEYQAYWAHYMRAAG